MGSGRVDTINSIIDDVVQEFNGSCSNEPVDEIIVDLAIANGIVLTQKEIEECNYAIDNIIFNCVGCGWWFETCEHAEGEHAETVCQNCVEE